MKTEEKNNLERAVMDLRKKFIEDNLKKAESKKGLTNWEKEFIASIKKVLLEGGTISQKQYNYLKILAEME